MDTFGGITGICRKLKQFYFISSFSCWLSLQHRHKIYGASSLVSPSHYIPNSKISTSFHCNQTTSKESVSRTDYFITTPIFYVNSDPHLGHLYTALLADAAHRFQGLLGSALCIFSTGTDEHGQKISRAALEAKTSSLEYCNKVSSRFLELFKCFDISYTRFIRTAEADHIKAVNFFIGKLAEQRCIYKGTYAGWYCISDESFLRQSQVYDKTLPSGETLKLSIESNSPVEWSSEDNYMFQLSNQQDNLKYWLLQNSHRIQPSQFHGLLLSWLSEDLHDLSVSRAKSKVPWGIPFPGDPDHTVYVWVDALINYLTVAGYPNLHAWPPHVQVLGKDILRFHGIYWPALLMAVGLEPPERLIVHSHWTAGGEKMSKSKGNVVSPSKCASKMTTDGVRYLLLRKGTIHSDCSWNDETGIQLLNAELADTLGNLLLRCTAPSLNPSKVFPSLCPQFLEASSDSARSCLNQMKELPNQVKQHYLDFRYYKGLEVIMEMLRSVNLFIDKEKPWKLKENKDRRHLDSVLHIAMSGVHAAGIALQPIVPNLAFSLLSTLGVPNGRRTWDDIQNFPSINHQPSPLGEKALLFKKIK